MTAVIKTERLTKSYGEHRGIVELDLEVAEGETFGFLGPTARARRRRCGSCSTSSGRRAEQYETTEYDEKKITVGTRGRTAWSERFDSMTSILGRNSISIKNR